MRTLTMSMMAAALAIAPAVTQAQTTPNPAGGATTTQTPATQAPATQTPATQAPATMKADEDFAKAAAESGMAEVELAKLAQKSTNMEIKALADRLVTDHGKANDELKTIAAKKGILLPAMASATHKATYDRIAKLTGAAFDQAWVAEIVAAHRSSVDRFRKESQDGKDPEFKTFAGKTLPTIEAHLAQAQKIQTAVGTTGNK
jgi:putative membrane protein